MQTHVVLPKQQCNKTLKYQHFHDYKRNNKNNEETEKYNKI